MKNEVPETLDQYVKDELGISLTELFEQSRLKLIEKLKASIEIVPERHYPVSVSVEIQPETEIIISWELQKNYLLQPKGYTSMIRFQLACLKMDSKNYEVWVKSGFTTTAEELVGALKVKQAVIDAV